MLTCSACNGVVTVEDKECPRCGFEFKVRKPVKPVKQSSNDAYSWMPDLWTPTSWKQDKKKRHERGLIRSTLDPLGFFDGII